MATLQSGSEPEILPDHAVSSVSTTDSQVSPRVVPAHVTSPPTKYVVRGGFRITVKQAIHRMQLLLNLDNRRPDLKILDQGDVALLQGEIARLNSVLDQRTPGGFPPS